MVWQCPMPPFEINSLSFNNSITTTKWSQASNHLYWDVIISIRWHNALLWFYLNQIWWTSGIKYVIVGATCTYLGQMVSWVERTMSEVRNWTSAVPALGQLQSGICVWPMSHRSRTDLGLTSHRCWTNMEAPMWGRCWADAGPMLSRCWADADPTLG